MNGVIQNMRDKNMNACKFKKGTSKFKKAYFPSLVNENPVKNTYKLDKHLIITGPNAAGKTTLLKTTIFNTDTARLKYYQIDKPELKRYIIDAHKKGLINI